MIPKLAILTTAAAAATALCLSMPGSASAASGWGPVQALSGTTNAASTSVAVNAAGDQAITLTTYDQQDVLLTARRAGAAWPTAQAPIAQHQWGRASIGPDGAARIPYVVDGRLYLKTLVPGATTASAGEYVAGDPCCDGAIAPSGGYSPQVTTGADGATIVLWMASNSGHSMVHWAVREAGARAFGPVGSTDAGAWIFGQPQMASNARGDVVIAWPEDIRPNDGNTEFAMRAMSRPAGGSFGAPAIVSSPNHHLEPPAVAIGADGSAVLAWRADSDPQRDGVIRAVSRAGADGAWTAEQDVAQTAADGGLPAVAVGGREMAVAFVQDSPSQRTATALGTVGGTFGAPAPLSLLAPRGLHVALGPDGTGILSLYDGDNGVWTSVRAPGAAAFPFIDPATSAAQPARGNAATAFDASGDALQAWAGSDGVERWRAWDGDPGSAEAPPAGATTTTDVAVTAPPLTSQAPLAVAAPATATSTSTADEAVTATAASTGRCAVPRVLALTRARAAARLRDARCALGTVTTPKKYKQSRGLVVRAQSRRAGTWAAVGSAVAVTLGPRAKNRR